MFHGGSDINDKLIHVKYRWNKLVSLIIAYHIK